MGSPFSFATEPTRARALELVPVVGLDGLDPERELLDDLVDEFDRIGL